MNRFVDMQIAGTAVVNLMNSTKFSDMVKPSQLEEGTKTTGIWTVVIFDSILSKALTSLHFLVLGGSEETNIQVCSLTRLFKNKFSPFDFLSFIDCPSGTSR